MDCCGRGWRPSLEFPAKPTHSRSSFIITHFSELLSGEEMEPKGLLRPRAATFGSFILDSGGFQGWFHLRVLEPGTTGLEFKCPRLPRPPPKLRCPTVLLLAALVQGLLLRS